MLGWLLTKTCIQIARLTLNNIRAVHYTCAEQLLHDSNVDKLRLVVAPLVAVLQRDTQTSSQFGGNILARILKAQ